MATKNKSNEIRITRVYDAPVEAVWNAWTDPAQVAQWWGPRGFTITTHSKDLRPGGHWHYTMHGPDGTDYVNTTKYFEVEPNAKLVYDHGGHEDRPPLFRVTARFSGTKHKTTLDMRMSFSTPEAADESREIIKRHGGNSTWDRLGEYLEKESSGKETFLIARTFETPIDTMYEMWTNPAHIAEWLAPTGFTMQILRGTIAQGDHAFYVMRGPGGLEMYGSIDYLELSKPNRLVYTQQFRDANEQISRHPMAPTWPETMLTTVTFTAEDDDHTRVAVRWEPYGNATQAEVATFIAERAGMTKGWTGSFDKLDAYLLTR